MSDLKYWVGFNRIPGIGRARFSQLEGYFGDLERAWKAGAAELEAAGLDSKSIEAIVAARPEISPDAEMEELERFKVKALTWNDPAFPPGSRRYTMCRPCSTSGAISPRRMSGL